MSKHSKEYRDEEPSALASPYVNRMVSGSKPTIAKAGTIRVRAKSNLVEFPGGERTVYAPGDEFDISKERAAALGSAVESV